LRTLSSTGRLGAGAAAAGRAAEADVAAATRVAAGLQAIAAGLQHVAAFGVAADASDAAAVGGVFTLAVAAAQAEVADLDAIPGATTGAGAIAQCLTKTLQSGRRNLIGALAVQLEAALALFEPEFAPGHDTDVRGRGGNQGGGRSRRTSRSESCPRKPFRHHSAGHFSTPFRESWPHPGLRGWGGLARSHAIRGTSGCPVSDASTFRNQGLPGWGQHSDCSLVARVAAQCQ
jgi:hypothetical protein